MSFRTWDRFEKVWRAQLMCPSPQRYFSEQMAAVHFRLKVDDIKNTKVVVEPKFQPSVMPCEDTECRLRLPNCEQFYWVRGGFLKPQYYCVECSKGFRPITGGVSAANFEEVLLNRGTIVLCELEETSGKRLVEKEWREEFPGCEVLSVDQVREDSFGGKTARYFCEECSQGFEQLPARDLPVFGMRFSPKKICRPIPALLPQPCEGKCRLMLPNCLEFVSRYPSSEKETLEISYKCTRCASGFVPLNLWTAASDFSEVTEFRVCGRTPTPGPVDCGQDCKETFPHCDTIQVSLDSEGREVFQCHRCEEGYFPMDYEDSAPGRISDPANFLKDKNRVYLCNKVKDEIHIDMIDCGLSKEMRNDDNYVDCHFTNCLLLAKTYNIATGAFGRKCLECREGFAVKKKTPKDLYDGGFDWCEKETKGWSE